MSFLSDDRYAAFVEANVVDERIEYTGGTLIQAETGEVFYVKTYPVTQVGDGHMRSSIYVKLAENPFQNMSVEGIRSVDGQIEVSSQAKSSILTVYIRIPDCRHKKHENPLYLCGDSACQRIAGRTKACLGP